MQILAWITIVYGLLANNLISLLGQVWILVVFSKYLRYIGDVSWIDDISFLKLVNQTCRILALGKNVQVMVDQYILNNVPSSVFLNYRHIIVVLDLAFENLIHFFWALRSLWHTQADLGMIIRLLLIQQIDKLLVVVSSLKCWVAVVFKS